MDEKTKSNTFIETFADGVSVATTGLSVDFGLEPVSATIIGSFLGNGIKSIYKEVVHRQLSKKENKRVSYVANRTIILISDRVKLGDTPGKNELFTSDVNGYCSAAEIFEGVLLIAKDQYEEKKLTFLSNFYCNIAFNEKITSTLANQMLKVLNNMTYQQLVVLGVLGDLDNKKITLNRKDLAYDNIKGVNNLAVALDIWKLYNETYVIDSNNQLILDVYAIEPVNLTLSPMGMLFYELCGLNYIDDKEAKNKVYHYLEGKDSELDDGISGSRRHVTWGSF